VQAHVADLAEGLAHLGDAGVEALRQGFEVGLLPAGGLRVSPEA
jgi:hypothetical protein